MHILRRAVVVIGQLLYRQEGYRPDCSRVWRFTRVGLAYYRSAYSCSSEDMSSKNLPRWRHPEGHGELKLYNSFTREKVRDSDSSTNLSRS